MDGLFRFSESGREGRNRSDEIVAYTFRENLEKRTDLAPKNVLCVVRKMEPRRFLPFRLFIYTRTPGNRTR